MAKTPDNIEDAENEVLREARRQKRLAKARAEESRARVKSGGKDEAKKSLDWKAAAGLGIGSAALLAALLYSKGDKK